MAQKIISTKGVVRAITSKISLVIILFVLSGAFPVTVFARSGCCSYHGGVCGCGCCDGTALSDTCAPYYPSCGGSSYTTYQAPPSCPLFASYDSANDQCKCNYGYVASGSTCISQDDACQKQLGFAAQYDSLTSSCGCMSGYIIDSVSNSCISGNQMCSNKYGYNATYLSYNNTCKCRSGYVFNDAGNKCISQDDFCQEKYGFSSKYDALKDACICNQGYQFNGNNCEYVIEPTPPPTNSFLFIAPSSVPKYNREPISPSPTTYSTPSAQTNSIDQKSPESNSNDTIWGFLILGGIGYWYYRSSKKKKNIKSSERQQNDN